MDDNKKQRKRRSYSCASCKQLKIKCDLLTPCSSCVKFKRVDKCLQNPPCPPSVDELDKIYHRKQRFKRKSEGESSAAGEAQVKRTSASQSHLVGNPYTVYNQGGVFTQATSFKSGMDSIKEDVYATGTANSVANTSNLQRHQANPILNPALLNNVQMGQNGVLNPAPNMINPPMPNIHPAQHHYPQYASLPYQPYPPPTAPTLPIVYFPVHQYMANATTSSRSISSGSTPQISASVSTTPTPSIKLNSNSPDDVHVPTFAGLYAPSHLATSDISVKNEFPLVASTSAVPTLNNMPPTNFNFASNKNAGNNIYSESAQQSAYDLFGSALPPVNPIKPITADSVLSAQYAQDLSIPIQLSAHEIQKIKVLLPSFERLVHLVKLYVRSEYVYVLKFFELDAMLASTLRLYQRLKDSEGEFTMSVVDIRVLSLMFLFMACGTLFEDDADSSHTNSSTQTDVTNKPFKSEISPGNFYRDQKETEPTDAKSASDYLSISKFLKYKIIRHDKLSDTLYLIAWYLVIKNYYAYEARMVENYMEYNNLLNYVVLNEQFMRVIMNDGNDSEYPKTCDFKLIASYWTQLRLIEVELSFFSYKGTIMASDSLKSSLLPHQALLDIVYGEKFSEIPDALSRILPQIWGLYYRRTNTKTEESTPSEPNHEMKPVPNPMTGLISSYLNLYADVLAIIRSENASFTKAIKRGPTPTDEKALSLLIMNQIALELFVRWLSFVRLEQGYFASLRYLSYLTSMQNLFEQFHLMDKQLGGGLLVLLVQRYRYSFLRPFFSALVYQGIFLVVLEAYVTENAALAAIKTLTIDIDQKDTDITGDGYAPGGFQKKNDKSASNPVDLNKLYVHTLRQFIATVRVFKSSDTPMSRTRVFAKTVESAREIAEYLEKRGLNKRTNGGGYGATTNWDTAFDFLSSDSFSSVLDTQFGSRATLVAYAEKVAECFSYLSTCTEPIQVTRDILFDEELVESIRGGFFGFDFDEAVVKEYMELHLQVS